MKHLTYFKLGQHRGAPRIWFEGRRLEDIGAMPGSRFDLRVDPATRSLTIIISESGVRRVSSKPDGRPCLDINTKALAAVLGPVDRVRATFAPGRIVVTVHPDDAAAAERLGRLNRRLNAGHALSVGSLFHGAGILDNALHAGLDVAGVKTALAFAVEIEDRFLQTSLRNNPIWPRDALAVAGSVDEVDLAALPKVDILTAGIPCTGASQAGRAKRGLDHAESHPTAGHLFVSFLAIVKATNPGIVIIENVPPYQHTASMEAIRGMLGVLGYELHETILDAHDLGTLEARKRLCAVAVTRGLPFSWEGLTAIRDREKCLGDVLDPAADGWTTMQHLKDKEERDRATYKDRKHGTGFAMQIVTAASTSVPTIGAAYYKRRSTEPKLAHPSDPDLLRQLTPAEHAAVKGIPFALVDGENLTYQHTMLGQSVCWPAFASVGAHLGRAIRRATAATRKPIRIAGPREGGSPVWTGAPLLPPERAGAMQLPLF